MFLAKLKKNTGSIKTVERFFVFFDSGTNSELSNASESEDVNDRDLRPRGIGGDERGSRRGGRGRGANSGRGRGGPAAKPSNSISSGTLCFTTLQVFRTFGNWRSCTGGRVCQGQENQQEAVTDLKLWWRLNFHQEDYKHAATVAQKVGDTLLAVCKGDGRQRDDPLPFVHVLMLGG